MPHPPAFVCARALCGSREIGDLMGTLRLPSGTGRAGEAAAAVLLRRSGYKIIERNFRVREGEIDIVAEHSGDLVFVEVKARRSGAFGKPEESLTEAKKARLVAAAQAYMAGKGLEHSDWRIDLVAVELDRTGRAKRVDVIRDRRDRTETFALQFPPHAVSTEPGVRVSRCYTSVPDSTDPCGAAFSGTQKTTPT